jgi:hypothetical protein
MNKSELEKAAMQPHFVQQIIRVGLPHLRQQYCEKGPEAFHFPMIRTWARNPGYYLIEASAEIVWTSR